MSEKMTRIAFVADLHGNLPATLAMERELAAWQPDEVWFLGDAVGKGPSNIECCDWARTRCGVHVGGNWDYGIGCREYDEDAPIWAMLGKDRMSWLAGLPREQELLLSGIRFRIFHGRPVAPFMRVQDDSELLTAALTRGDGERFGGVIFADTHRPFFRTLDAGYIMNTGSVGNSLGVTRAHALLLEGVRDVKEEAPLRVSILSVPYDRAQAIADCPADMRHRDEYIIELTKGVYTR